MCPRTFRPPSAMRHAYAADSFRGVIMAAVGMAAALMPSLAFAATVTWTGGGADANWSTGGNWSSGSAPGSGDLAQFNGTSATNATISSSVTVGGILIASAYTGIITQSTGATITVGTQDFTQAGGTFLGGDGAISIDGSLLLSGGTFRATSGIITLSRTVTRTGGTFTHHGGTLDFEPLATDITLTTGGATFGSIIMHRTNNTGTARTITLADSFSMAGDWTLKNEATLTARQLRITAASTPTVTVGGTLSFPFTSANSPVYLGSTTTTANWNLSLAGNLDMSDTGANFLAIPTLTGSAVQTVSISAGTFSPSLWIYKSGGSATLQTAVSLLSSGQGILVGGGMLDLNGHNLSLNTALTVQSGATLQLQGGESVSAGGGILLQPGSAAVYNGAGTYAALAAGGTYHHLTFSGAGTWMSAAPLSVQGALSVANGTFMQGTQTVAVGGGVHVGSAGTFVKSSNGSVLTLDGTQTVTDDTSGTNLGVVDVSSSSTVTLRGNIVADTFTIETGSTVLARGSALTAGTLTNNGTLDALTGVSSAFAMLLTGNFVNRGTFFAGNSALTFSGSLFNTGTFTPGTGTVTLSGHNQTLSGSLSFYALTKTSAVLDALTVQAGKTITIGSSLVLHGASGALLALHSTSSGSTWTIDPQGTRTVSWLSVRDSINIDATDIACTSNCADEGNNTKWIFIVSSNSSSSSASSESSSDVSSSLSSSVASTSSVSSDASVSSSSFSSSSEPTSAVTTQSGGGGGGATTIGGHRGSGVQRGVAPAAFGGPALLSNGGSGGGTGSTVLSRERLFMLCRLQIRIARWRMPPQVFARLAARLAERWRNLPSVITRALVDSDTCLRFHTRFSRTSTLLHLVPGDT